MGFIGSLFSGSKGAGFQAQGANILNPLGTDQAQQGYNQAQGALSQQQDFVNALNAQNGLGNQSSVFNQLQGVANGTGPNPAQAMLSQAAGQNSANTAAQIAGARGTNYNPGLVARNAANAGSQIQQNAAGQAATMQANQSLNALNQLGGIAGQQVGQQAQGVSNLNQFGQGQENQVLNQINAQNQANLGNTSQQNQANATIANTNAGNQAKGVGGLFNAVGSGFNLFAEGGEVSKGPKSFIGQYMAKGGKVEAKVSPGEIYLPPSKAKAVAAGKASPLSGERIQGKAKVKGDSYSNDTVSKSLDAGGVVIPRSKAIGDDVATKAADFVRAVMSHQGMKRARA